MQVFWTIHRHSSNYGDTPVLDYKTAAVVVRCSSTLLYSNTVCGPLFTSGHLFPFGWDTSPGLQACRNRGGRTNGLELAAPCWKEVGVSQVTRLFVLHRNHQIPTEYTLRLHNISQHVPVRLTRVGAPRSPSPLGPEPSEAEASEADVLAFQKACDETQRCPKKFFVLVVLWQGLFLGCSVVWESWEVFFPLYIYIQSLKEPWLFCGISKTRITWNHR